MVRHPPHHTLPTRSLVHPHGSAVTGRASPLKSGNPLTTRTKRHLELLDLADGLRCYASDRQADTNAAFLLVHQALTTAFSEAPGLRSSASLRHSLRQDIDRGIASQMGARLSILRP